MDFFDPQKQKRHRIRLAVGYAVIGVTLLLATTVLLYHARGYGVDKQGRVIQNGLVFVSSKPSGAQVYLDGVLYKDATDTRVNLPAGQYVMEIKRVGYRDWKRALVVEAEAVQRFDYPFLFPSSLTTTTTKRYEAAPIFTTQSLDRRWLVVAKSEPNTFDLYDLNAKQPVAQSIDLSQDILAAGTTTTGWQLVEWAKDNRHVVLKRSYDRLGQAGSEYILFDREQPERSQNLSILFGFTPNQLELRGQAYDQYYLYDQNGSQLLTATLGQPTPQPYIGGVLAFTSEKDTVVYVTAEKAGAGKVLIRLKRGNDPALTVRHVPAGSSYILDLAVYEHDLFLAAGAASENRVFLYKDPIGGLRKAPNEPLAPVQILKVTSPNHVSFSPNERFVIVENANSFSVYDAETDRGYAYQIPLPPDTPQAHAVWMDGFRLTYVSVGKVVVFDYDGTNMQSLSAASPVHLPIFDRNYRYLYTIDQTALTSTALLIQEDL